MIDLTTSYAGLKLKNPLVASSSPLTANLKKVIELQKAGVAAIILPSLFEEEILSEEEAFYNFAMEQDSSSAEGDNYLPQSLNYENASERYLSLIESFKKSLTIPVIASLNGSSAEVLSSHAKDIEQAGADALELNLYQVVCKVEQAAQQVEDDYIALLEAVRDNITIPIIVKLSSQFTSIPHFVKRIEQAGLDGVSIFNRFYQPNIHLDTHHIKHDLELSSSYESHRRIRWAAILRDQVDLSIAVTGGIHTSEEVIKAILAGADITCLCSTILINGTEQITTILKGVESWLEEKECLSIEQIKGSVSYVKAIDSASYERAAYVDLMSKNNWKLS